MTIEERIFQHALKGSKKYFYENSEIVLKHLPNWKIEDYAKWDLDLIEKDEAKEYCRCNDIDSCSNADIIEEFIQRNLQIPSDNLVTQDITNRFYKILERDNPLKILAIIEQLEKENNL